MSDAHDAPAKLSPHKMPGMPATGAETAAGKTPVSHVTHDANDEVWREHLSSKRAFSRPMAVVSRARFGDRALVRARSDVV